MKIQRAKCVYAIFNPETKRVKIGIAEDITRRLSVLEGGAGCKLEVIGKTRPILDAEEAERSGHIRLKDKRHFGEWFNISKEEAVDCIRYIESKYPPEEFVGLYLQGKMKVPEIAEKYGVTRQAVVKRLRQYCIYGVSCPSEIKRVEQTNEEVNIIEYTRINKNTYEHKITGEVKNIKWVNGKFMAYNEI